MVKNRFATKALNLKDESILVTLELNISSMEIEVKSFPLANFKDDETEDFIKKFSAGEEVNFPESTTIESRSFTEESLLPDTIKLEGKSGAIRQLQNEWSYLLLNAKLFEQFNTQLDEIKQKASEVKQFSHELFDEAKEFWEKVLEYKKEREISQEKLVYFKEEINGVFDHLKHLKESMLKEKDEISERIKQEFTEALQAIDKRLEEQGVRFNTIMDELKALHVRLRSEDVKRDVKNILFDNIQAGFEKVKVKREQAIGGSNQSRIDGLTLAYNRMSKSLEMDKKDLDFNTKKLNQVDSKLELQLREAKINVLKDRIASKEEKVADIKKTLEKLTKKVNHQKEVENKKPIENEDAQLDIEADDLLKKMEESENNSTASKDVENKEAES